VGSVALAVVTAVAPALSACTSGGAAHSSASSTPTNSPLPNDSDGVEDFNNVNGADDVTQPVPDKLAALRSSAFYQTGSPVRQASRSCTANRGGKPTEAQEAAFNAAVKGVVRHPSDDPSHAIQDQLVSWFCFRLPSGQRGTYWTSGEGFPLVTGASIPTFGDIWDHDGPPTKTYPQGTPRVQLQDKAFAILPVENQKRVPVGALIVARDGGMFREPSGEPLPGHGGSGSGLIPKGGKVFAAFATDDGNGAILLYRRPAELAARQYGKFHALYFGETQELQRLIEAIKKNMSIDTELGYSIAHLGPQPQPTPSAAGLVTGRRDLGSKGLALAPLGSS
jgi:hypothetical protein